MSNSIHPTAVIAPGAQLADGVEVGPYAVIDAHVTVGANCRIGPHAHLTGHTTIGERNIFHTGCVIGGPPQDLKYHDAPTRLVIGDDNVFREHSNAHRSNKVEEDTLIGNRNFIMANAHIGHNCHVGDRTIIANGVLIAGHAVIGDAAFLSGNSLVHQFVRVGTLALMQGGSAVSLDLPPFTIARGDNGICGLNVVGLRRAGFDAAARLELKQLYALLFRKGIRMREALEQARQRFASAPALAFVEFVAASKRGVCADRGGRAVGREK